MRDEPIVQIVEGRPSLYHRGRWYPLPSGGDGTPTDPPPEPEQPEPEVPEEAAPEDAEASDEQHAPELPDDLTNVDEETLRELHSTLDAWRVTSRERQDAIAVRDALAAQGRIAEEINRRREERAQRLAELAELDEIEVPVLPEPEPEPAIAGAGASAAQLAAAASRASASPATRHQAPPPAPRQRPRVALLAAAGTDTVGAGQPMTDAQLGQAIDRAKRGRAGRTILASIPSFEEMNDPTLPAILSDRNGAILNDELIHEAVADWYQRVDGSVPARVAAIVNGVDAGAGGICDPLDIIRDIPDAFSTATPVADIFPARPSGRGGFQYTPSGTLADVAGAVNLWDLTDQAGVDPDDSSTWKPCIDYDCPDTASAVVEAIVTCVQFPITLEMSNPERVRNLNNATGALRARTHEGRLLQRIDQLSHPFVFSGDYGALPALVEAINSLLPQLNWWNRQEQGRYDVLLPPAVPEVLRIDRANRAYGTEMETQDVLDYLLANIDCRRIVLTLDPSLGGEPGTFADPLPPVGNQAAAGAIPYISGAAYRIRLVDPAAAIYAESGEMNAGVLRDAQLVRQNRTGYFTEEFFFLAKHGPQPWATIDLVLCADGSRAGLIDPSGCATS